jgi:hypothetical protein
MIVSTDRWRDDVVLGHQDHERTAGGSARFR